MKILFIVVSVLAASYLLMQTAFVKSQWQYLTHNKSAAAMSIAPISGEQVKISPEHAELLIGLASWKQQSRAQTDLLTQQVKQLTTTLEDIKGAGLQLNSNQEASSQTNRISDPNTLPEQASQATNISNRVATEPSVTQSFNDINISKNDKQAKKSREAQLAQTNLQKRLQQQAILRELSQKMELSALSGLSH